MRRSRGAVEHGEEAITGRLDLASPEDVELGSNADVVGNQEFLPRGVADPFEGGGRGNDVREHDGGEGPAPAFADCGLHGPPGRAPLDRDPGLVADDPLVVSGWDLVDRVRPDVQCLAVVHDHAHDS
jgi:hypothetical protein